MQLSNKIIFIISYENWGKMLMSKHHYAIELGKAGNKVYFINHPDKRKELKRGEVKVEQTASQNVMVVRHRLFHPYFLKFKFSLLYNLLTARHVRKILKSIGSKPDIVWSFDTGNSLPLKYFPDSAIKIFMPVDGPFGTNDENNAAEQSDAIISVTGRILDAYAVFDRPKYQINHGVASVFLNGKNRKSNGDVLRIGYSGSLIRSDLDTSCFLSLIKNHPDKIFEFWGEYNLTESNIHLPQDISRDTVAFLDILKSQPNVIMHGPVNSETLAEGLRRMDILLICYAIKNDQNHHKVLEYLGTGSVIISNHMSSYANVPGLLEMPGSTESNKELPVIFQRVVDNIEYYNSEELRQKRIRYAMDHSYLKNITRIEAFINNNITSRKQRTL
jgi:hypothetical protein